MLGAVRVADAPDATALRRAGLTLDVNALSTARAEFCWKTEFWDAMSSRLATVRGSPLQDVVSLSLWSAFVTRCGDFQHMLGGAIELKALRALPSADVASQRIIPGLHDQAVGAPALRTLRLGLALALSHLLNISKQNRHQPST